MIRAPRRRAPSVSTLLSASGPPRRVGPEWASSITAKPPRETPEWARHRASNRPFLQPSLQYKSRLIEAASVLLGWRNQNQISTQRHAADPPTLCFPLCFTLCFTLCFPLCFPLCFTLCFTQYSN
ncbi:unnamed protein product [Lota lota]